MAKWGKRNVLTILTSAIASVALICLCIGVSTDFWLYTQELIEFPVSVCMKGSTTTESLVPRPCKIMVRTHSGLWRRCVDLNEAQEFSDKELTDHDHENLVCVKLEYYKKLDREGMNMTDAVLQSIQKATPFPLTSLGFLIIGGLLCFISHCNTRVRLLIFIAGVFFILSGLFTLIGIILYIVAVTEEAGSRPRVVIGDFKFSYTYESSFNITIASFILVKVAGVLSMYLYIYRLKRSFKIQQRLNSQLVLADFPRPPRPRRAGSCGGDCSFSGVPPTLTSSVTDGAPAAHFQTHRTSSPEPFKPALHSADSHSGLQLRSASNHSDLARAPPDPPHFRAPDDTRAPSHRLPPVRSASCRYPAAPIDRSSSNHSCLAVANDYRPPLTPTARLLTYDRDHFRRTTPV